jgi:glycosyltransferase involved in cell wall biosynthesis
MRAATDQSSPDRFKHHPHNQHASGFDKVATSNQPTVSIIIKALNEERHIASAIESALASLGDIDGEVILADGGSSDRTIEIARAYPITIVQLNHADDRSCGSGAQLGYQYSRGRYIYIADGDMQLRPGFVPSAVRFLDENPAVAGVGGIVIDQEIANLEYAQRTNRHDPDRYAGPVTRLHSGGVYRRSAIESIGYLTDRNLHGAEELDLAARLHARGWTLARINCRSVDHYGHTGSAYRLLLRRVATRNSYSLGEIVRAAIGRSHFWFVVGNDKNTLLCLLIAGWWAAMMVMPFVLSGFSAVFAITMVFLFPFACMFLRWRSVQNALYSVVAWNVYALSFFPGFLRPRVSPTSWIESTLLKEGVPSDGAHEFAVRVPAANLDNENSRTSAPA